MWETEKGVGGGHGEEGTGGTEAEIVPLGKRG